ncbi:unnamed protein product [Ilex paraguariensis]|uniref:AMP-dependent synthetase/ligase domain-containing protein n=1 Tax=Ilex paraguariensis TaxID=185542 RepID=A0ABC8R4R0_9AQUA
MAEMKTRLTIDPKNGFCALTKTFQSIRPPVPLPPLTQPLSITEYVLSLLHSTTTNSTTTPATPFLIDATNGDRLSYSDLLHQTKTFSSSLQTRFPSLSKGQVALIVSPPSVHVPVLYFSLLSLGVIVSPANPLSTQAELNHLLELTKPVIAFTTSSFSNRFTSLPLGTIVLDSPEFLSMMQTPQTYKPNRVEIHQSDSAAILYSSGTTGRVKGVELTHRNLIAVIAGLFHNRNEDEQDLHPVSLFTLPLFHVFGFFMIIRAAALGETCVLLERFDFENMLKAVEKYKVTYMPVSPPLVVAMAKSDLVGKYDLSSLQLLGCGGAPLGKEVSERFTARFPHVEIVQGYGMTETGGGATRMIGPDESKQYGSTGRLAENMEAKIVDPVTGEALPPGQQGELWLRGPLVMKGAAYVPML